MAGEGGPDQDRVRGRGPADRAREEIARGVAAGQRQSDGGLAVPEPVRREAARHVRVCEPRDQGDTQGKVRKGLYAARRGMATALVGLTGNAVSAQGMLRHANMATTLAFYKKDTPLETLAGMKLLEAAADKKEE